MGFPAKCDVKNSCYNYVEKILICMIADSFCLIASHILFLKSLIISVTLLKVQPELQHDQAQVKNRFKTV